MKLNQKLIIRRIAGEYIAVPVKTGDVSLEGIVTANEVGASILQLLENDIGKERIVERIMDEYDVDEETACHDVDEFIGQLSEIGLLCE